MPHGVPSTPKKGEKDKREFHSVAGRHATSANTPRPRRDTAWDGRGKGGREEGDEKDGTAGGLRVGLLVPATLVVELEQVAHVLPDVGFHLAEWAPEVLFELAADGLEADLLARVARVDNLLDLSLELCLAG